MHFLDKRILGICNELKKLSIKQKAIINNILYKKGNFVFPEDAENDSSEFEIFDSCKMHWYGPDEHYFFKADYTIPEDFDGKAFWLNVRTQIVEWDDAKNPQFLLFVNGKATQGIDMNHRSVLIERNARAGTKYHFDLQAYTGTLHSEFNLFIEAQEIDAEIEALYYDLKVPLDAFSRLDKQSHAYMNLERELNSAINLLDLRTPYNLDFYNSLRDARDYLSKNLYQKLGGHDEIVASCIGHTHIDVAWWWTVAQTREKTARSFATVLKLMEEYPDYKFMSSQPQLYQFLKERHPELYEQVKQKIKEKRWEPEGGTWIEPDCNLTSGESLVRQFIHGKRFFKEEFGVDNQILWLPDVFGYSGALPQIMKKSGIEYFMTTKLAWNQFNKMPYDTFMWRGIDGSEILTHLVTTLGVGQSDDNFFTTYNGILHPDSIIGGWNRYQNKDINNDILITYGYGDGGGGPTREMLETSSRMEKGIEGIPKVRQVFSRTYFDELDKRVKNNPRLPIWEGELYFEYHRGTYTSMARNKRSNRKAEFHLMDLEFFGVLAEPKIPYPSQELDKLWKTLLLNQFHDILPGSSIREVYEVTKKEYAEIEEKIEFLLSERISSLVEESDCITLFNTTGFMRNDIVSIGDCKAKALKDSNGEIYQVQQTESGAVAFIKNLPPKGCLSLEESEEIQANGFFKLSENILETPFYIVEINENGHISRLFDKENKREVLQENKSANIMRMYEDKPIYYDNWDIDIFYTEKSWDLSDTSVMEWEETGPVRAALYIERKFSNSTLSQNIYFYANSRRIDFETTVDWKENQHLLKVHFPLNVHTDEATFDIQFGNLTRKVHTNTSWDVARFESCGQKWIDLSEGHYGVSLLNDCKYGHSVKDSCIGLTLIKSGIEPNPTTDQEMHFFTYSLYPHKNNWRDGGTVAEAYYLNQPVITANGGKCGTSFSLAHTNAANVIIETIKKAEDGNGIIIRIYESDNALTPTKLFWNGKISAVEECNLIEEKICDTEYQEGIISFTLKPYEIKTFRIIE